MCDPLCSLSQKYPWAYESFRAFQSLCMNNSTNMIKHQLLEIIIYVCFSQTLPSDFSLVITLGDFCTTIFFGQG